MTRRLSGEAPGLQCAPLREYQDETWADYVRRQARPVKPKQPRNFRPPTNSAAAEALAVAVAKKEADDHEPVASSQPQ